VFSKTNWKQSPPNSLHILKKTFKKDERLCSVKVIDDLFDRKNSANGGVFAYPLRVVFQPYLEPESSKNPSTNSQKPTQVLFSVPKRQFKHAVDRNLIRRRMKEAYRLNKNQLSSTFSIAFIYIGKGIEKYEVIEKGMKGGFRKMKAV
jgi:ribonuclease P protein component